MKYIKIGAGIAVNKKTVWLGSVQDWPNPEGKVKFYFRIGDDKQDFTLTFYLRSKALRKWTSILNSINAKKE